MFKKLLLLLYRNVLFDYFDELKLLVHRQDLEHWQLGSIMLILVYCFEVLRCLVFSYQVWLCDMTWLYHDPLIAVVNPKQSFGSGIFLCFAGFCLLIAIMTYLLKFVIPRNSHAHSVLSSLIIDDLGQFQRNNKTIKFGRALRFLCNQKTLEFCRSLPSYPALNQDNRNRLVRFLLLMKIILESLLFVNGKNLKIVYHGKDNS